MDSSYHVTVVSSRYGRGEMTFFDEPFGEQMPFELAGGFTVSYESGMAEGGAISAADLALGLDSWLASNHWMKLEELLSSISV
jgi:hypothetical protein